MKKKQIIVYVLIVFSIVSTAVLMMFMPETVPAHYSLSGEVDRFGSKYENLILPLVSVVMGIVFIYLSKAERKKNGESNEKVLLIIAICTLLFFNILSIYLMIKAITYDAAQLQSVSPDITKFSSIAIGLLLIVLGNFMPKTRRNSNMGVRTKWSLSSDEVWQKSQRFGGISAVVTGAIMIVSSIFVPGITSLIIFTFLIVVWSVLCVVMSWKYYKDLNK